jgi:hypothetical protein
MKPILLLLWVGGCASSPAIKPTEKGALVEIANVPDGQNCYPVRGPGHDRGEVCAFRLRSALDDLVGRMLDGHLADPSRYRARLELEDVRFTTAATNPSRYDQRTLTYHFTLQDAAGQPVVDVQRTLAEPISGIHHGTTRPIPYELLLSWDLYCPPVLYQMLFEMVDQIAGQIDAARA